MGNEFKKGDTVYYGTLKGEVVKQCKIDTPITILVHFKNVGNLMLLEDGRFYQETPIILSHFPYKLEMKRVEEVIAKDTIVWYRDFETQNWMNGYYSHFKDGKHYIFTGSLKSTEAENTCSWNIATTKNPLI